MPRWTGSAPSDAAGSHRGRVVRRGRRRAGQMPVVLGGFIARATTRGIGGGRRRAHRASRAAPPTNLWRWGGVSGVCGPGCGSALWVRRWVGRRATNRPTPVWRGWACIPGVSSPRRAGFPPFRLRFSVVESRGRLRWTGSSPVGGRCPPGTATARATGRQADKTVGIPGCC